VSKRDGLYASYVTWRSWEDAPDAPDGSFETEVARTGIEPPARVLEIGFGQGQFLCWARKRGYTVTGVDLIPELVYRASDQGFTVYCGRAEDIPELRGQKFDLIAAFDVFEHLTCDELLVLLGFLRKILRPSGRILARFPNGGSPFSLPYQHGDATHQTALGAAAMTQTAIAAGLKVLWVGNAARPMNSGKHHWIAKRLAYLARDAIEVFIGRLYFQGRVPLDPNLTAVIGGDERRVAASAPKETEIAK